MRTKIIDYFKVVADGWKHVLFENREIERLAAGRDAACPDGRW